MWSKVSWQALLAITIWYWGQTTPPFPTYRTCCCLPVSQPGLGVGKSNSMDKRISWRESPRDGLTLTACILEGHPRPSLFLNPAAIPSKPHWNSRLINCWELWPCAAPLSFWDHLVQSRHGSLFENSIFPPYLHPTVPFFNKSAVFHWFFANQMFEGPHLIFLKRSPPKMIVSTINEKQRRERTTRTSSTPLPCPLEGKFEWMKWRFQDKTHKFNLPMFASSYPDKYSSPTEIQRLFWLNSSLHPPIGTVKTVGSQNWLRNGSHPELPVAGMKIRSFRCIILHPFVAPIGVGNCSSLSPKVREP